MIDKNIVPDKWNGKFYYPWKKDSKDTPWNPEPSKYTPPWFPEHDKFPRREEKKFPWDDLSIPDFPIPAKPKGEFDDFTIEELEKLEKDCAGKEDYEKCARIRDEIKRRKSC